MKYIRAKIGTHAVQRILHLKGAIKLGSFITWVEEGTSPKWGRKETGVIDKINTDGLIFVERM